MLEIMRTLFQLILPQKQTVDKKMKYISLMLSTSRGLFGEISPNLRGVFIEQAKSEACVNFYYDNPFSEDEHEMASLTHTEVISDFIDIHIDFKVLSWSSPKPLPKEGYYVYLRYGELGKLGNLQPYVGNYPTFYGESIFVCSNLSIIKAMFGKITPNLRGIQIQDDYLGIDFYYEFPPSEEEITLASLIHQEYADFFESSEKISFNLHTLSTDQMIPKIGLTAYLRYPECGTV